MISEFIFVQIGSQVQQELQSHQYLKCNKRYQSRGGARNFPTGVLTLPTRGLKYGFQGIVNAKNLRQNSFSPSDGG